MGTILAEMMADEFKFLWSIIQNSIAEADADEKFLSKAN